MAPDYFLSLIESSNEWTKTLSYSVIYLVDAILFSTMFDKHVKMQNANQGLFKCEGEASCIY